MTRLVAQGKVRDVLDAGPDRLMLVATDRISAFDVVLPDPVPDKGRVLTGLALHWFERTADLVANHVISSGPFEDRALAGRVILVRRAQVIPLECVARGYLSGSAWASYAATGTIFGDAASPGLVESAALPEPIFTPTTKATEGHDRPLSIADAAEVAGRGLVERLRELTIAVYERLAAHARARGVIVADTKLEFGFADGELILIDEVGTPDSSRFWPEETYEPGRPQPSFDKQFVRDWLDASGWDREPPPPALPDDVISATRERYVHAYEILTGEPFGAYLRRAGVEA